MNGGQERGGTLRTLMVPYTRLGGRVILDNMDDLGTPEDSYSESFKSLSLFLAEI